MSYDQQSYKAGYQAGRGRRNAHIRYRGVRYRKDVGFEMWCATCAAKGSTSYWPITEEFWYRRNLTQCRACILEQKRRAAKEAYWRDPETERRRVAAYKAATAEVQALKRSHRWSELTEAQREAYRSYRRARYVRRRDETLAYQRAWRARQKAA